VTVTYRRTWAWITHSAQKHYSCSLFVLFRLLCSLQGERERESERTKGTERGGAGESTRVRKTEERKKVRETQKANSKMVPERERENKRESERERESMQSGSEFISLLYFLTWVVKPEQSPQCIARMWYASSIHNEFSQNKTHSIDRNARRFEQ